MFSGGIERDQWLDLGFSSVFIVGHYSFSTYTIHTHVGGSGSKKCYFFEKLCVLIPWLMSIYLLSEMQLKYEENEAFLQNMSFNYLPCFFP